MSEWRKSSYSQSDGSCLEVCPLAADVAARDSKLAESPVISFGRRQWTDFVRSVTRVA
ncbi:DUF397 domain-containing protein [Embleya sp. NPDC005971]|uniref:DUF397 domain-containing protein n=1 Tax=unclassified Embleya TaxID=2699296 RepID=UPI0033E1D847